MYKVKVDFSSLGEAELITRAEGICSHLQHTKEETAQKTLLRNLQSGVRYFIKVASVNAEANRQNHYNFTAVLSRITQ